MTNRFRIRRRKFTGFQRAALVTAALAVSAGAAPQAPDSIQDLLVRLEVGRPVSHGCLTVVPVYADRARDPAGCVTLEEALARGWLEISELDGGRVPLVRMSNLSKRRIFVMGGEILTGCRQDRIQARDLLIGPGRRDLAIPVFCVEQGRWSAVSPRFTSKANLGTPSLRARAMTGAPGAQAEIWGKISEQNRRLRIRSDSDAYQAAFEASGRKTAIDRVEAGVRRELKLGPDVVGVVIGLGNRVVGVDIFADAALFRKQWPKILKSSALSSLQIEEEGRLTRDRAADFLRGFQGRRFQARPALDLGSELFVSDSDLQASALVFKGSVLHLAGFPVKERIRVIKKVDPEHRVRVIREPVSCKITGRVGE